MDEELKYYFYNVHISEQTTKCINLPKTMTYFNNFNFTSDSVYFQLLSFINLFLFITRILIKKYFGFLSQQNVPKVST